MQDKLYEASALHNVAVGKWQLMLTFAMFSLGLVFGVSGLLLGIQDSGLREAQMGCSWLRTCYSYI